jgi:hypothetical protein
MRTIACMGRDSEDRIGHGWLEIIRRPSLNTFAAAFVPDAVLEASVLKAPVVGVAAIRAFFDATRAMYDSIAFVHETRSAVRTYMEWEGQFAGQEVAGTTILAHDDAGLIQSVRLYHRPYEQVTAFSAELAKRLAGAPVSEATVRERT